MTLQKCWCVSRRISLWQNNHPQESELVQEPYRMAAEAPGTEKRDCLSVNDQPDVERD